MNVVQNERGAAMIVAIGILLMLSLIGIASIETSSTDGTISNNYGQDMRSFYLAEAGIEHSVGILRDTPGWRTGLANVALGGGTYSVRVFDKDSLPALRDTVLLKSTGVRSGAVSEVAVRLVAGSLFRWSAFGDQRFDLNGGTQTDSYNSDSGSYAATRVNANGDIGSNGIVGINGNATIRGAASTSSPGNMTIGGSSIVTGDTTTRAPVTNLPPVTVADINNAKAVSAAPAGLSGNFQYNAGGKSLAVQPGNTLTLASGTYYFSTMDIKGNIQVAPNATVKIYTDGDMQANATANINIAGNPAQLQIYMRGAKLTVNGGAQMRAAVYAPQSLMEFNGNGTYYGSYIASNIQQNGASFFHYDRALNNLHYGDLTRVAWQQL